MQHQVLNIIVLESLIFIQNDACLILNADGLIIDVGQSDLLLLA